MNGTVDIWIFKKGLTPVSPLSSSTTAYLTNLWTKHRRHGYGTKLVEVALDRARRLGAKRVTLWVRDTKTARSFWKTFGVGVKKLGTWGVIKIGE